MAFIVALHGALQARRDVLSHIDVPTEHRLSPAEDCAMSVL